MTLGENILAIINFLEYPAWHLIALYVILLLMVAWHMYKTWFP
jgi:hypothetical protein